MQEKDLRDIADGTPPVKTPGWLVSPESHASPRPHPNRRPGEMRWYLPGWSERFKLMGWRNIAWLPAIGVLLSIVLLAPRPMWLLEFLAYWKLWLIIVAVPVALAIEQSRKAIRLRADLFCIHCGYSLNGLPSQSHPCPECGELTDPAQSIEHKRDPHWYIERHRQAHQHPTDHQAFDAGTNRQENPDRL